MPVSKEKTQLLYEYDKPIIWNISGFGNESEMYLIDNIINGLSKFNIKPPITSLHGSYSCKYNGGRTALYFNFKNNIKDKIKHFNDLGIGIKLTFSNSEIHKDTINEEEMRWYLDILNEIKGIGNGIICINDDFAKEVKKQYPDLELVASHVKMEAETRMGVTDTVDYYNSKFDLYDIVVFNTYRAFDDDFLSKINHPEKVEFIVNHTCTTNCPYAKYHHLLIDKLQKQKIKFNNNINLFRTDPETIEIKKEIDKLLFECAKIKQENDYDKLIKQTLNRAEINHLNNTFGINRFKIEGRDLSTSEFNKYLYTYLLNNDSFFDKMLIDYDNLNKKKEEFKSRMC